MEKLAAVHSRKELERQLGKARSDLNDARTQHDMSSAQLAKLQQTVDEAHARMHGAKNSLRALTEHIHNMDLSGAHSLKDRGDVKTYLVDNKEYHIEKNDVNDVKLIPWKEYKAEKEPKADEQKAEDDNYAFDVGYSFASAFKLIRK